MWGWVKKASFWLAVLVLIGLLVTINMTSEERENLTVAEEFIREVFAPAQIVITNLKTDFKNISAILDDKKALKQQIEWLKSENDRLTLENQGLREYKAEAERLRNDLDFININIDTYELTAARIIARSSSNWHKTITIDKGRNQGIEMGMPVIRPDGLVGRVESVTENTAQIRLITDREVAVGAIIQETRETNGIVEGAGNSEYVKMINIPYYSDIKKGYTVVTSGLASMFPKGIAIGDVTEVAREPNGLLLSAVVKPKVNFDKMEEVLIIVGSGETRVGSQDSGIGG
ncbi:MAG: rod shape-determining protein MreC [Syntrophomonadaceae bacterium]